MIQRACLQNKGVLVASLQLRASIQRSLSELSLDAPKPTVGLKQSIVQSSARLALEFPLLGSLNFSNRTSRPHSRSKDTMQADASNIPNAISSGLELSLQQACMRPRASFSQRWKHTGKKEKGDTHLSIIRINLIDTRNEASAARKPGEGRCTSNLCAAKPPQLSTLSSPRVAGSIMGAYKVRSTLYLCWLCWSNVPALERSKGK